MLLSVPGSNLGFINVVTMSPLSYAVFVAQLHYPYTQGFNTFDMECFNKYGKTWG